MKINIVCDEANGGWIYSRFIEQFKKHSKHQILINEKDPNKYDVCYFLPYYTYFKSNKPSVCWISHQEKSEPLCSKFVQVAKSVDVGISHSKKYAMMLRDNHQCENIMYIIPGIDTDMFSLRSVKRKENSKMVVGYIGRQYTSSARKNPALLKKISELPFVDFRTTWGNMAFKDVPGFYRQLDVVVSPAIIEGGPICIQEALAVGVPVITMKGVGVADEFSDGVIKADSNDDFIAKLKDLYVSKKYLTYWRNPDIMKKMRHQVEGQTWKKWVEEHGKVFDMITSKSWRSDEVR